MRALERGQRTRRRGRACRRPSRAARGPPLPAVPPARSAPERLIGRPPTPAGVQLSGAFELATGHVVNCSRCGYRRRGSPGSGQMAGAASYAPAHWDVRRCERVRRCRGRSGVVVRVAGVLDGPAPRAAGVGRVAGGGGVGACAVDADGFGVLRGPGAGGLRWAVDAEGDRARRLVAACQRGRVLEVRAERPAGRERRRRQLGAGLGDGDGGRGGVAPGLALGVADADRSGVDCLPDARERGVVGALARAAGRGPSDEAGAGARQRPVVGERRTVTVALPVFVIVSVSDRRPSATLPWRRSS